MDDQKITNQDSENATPADNGGKERLFTQEEVNKIVAERLARERDKNSGGPDVEQLAELLSDRLKEDLAAFVSESKGAEESLAQELDGREAELAAAQAELDMIHLREEKLRALSFKHIEGDVAQTLATILQGNDIAEFETSLLGFLSAFGPAVFTDMNYIPPKTSDSVLRDAFGLQKG